MTKFEFKAIIEFAKTKLSTCGFPPKTSEKINNALDELIQSVMKSPK